MDSKKIITVACFGVALMCAIAMFPLTSQLVSLPAAEIGSDAYKSKWLLDCILGIVGLVSAITGQRLSKDVDRDR